MLLTDKELRAMVRERRRLENAELAASMVEIARSDVDGLYKHWIGDQLTVALFLAFRPADRVTIGRYIEQETLRPAVRELVDIVLKAADE